MYDDGPGPHRRRVHLGQGQKNSCTSARPTADQLYSAGPQGACELPGGAGLPGSACGCGLVWVQSESRPLSVFMVWVACRSGKLAVVPAYGSGSLTSRLPRHRDGTNSGITMAIPTRASTPSKSKASKPVP